MNLLVRSMQFSCKILAPGFFIFAIANIPNKQLFSLFFHNIRRIIVEKASYAEFLSTGY